MKKDGYLIARNRRVDQFFTSASAYDRPEWRTPASATIYRTVELAESALKKLLRTGNYEARLVPVAEAMEFEMPGAKKKTTLPTDDERDQLDQEGGNPEDLPTDAPDDAQMVAGGDPQDPEANDGAPKEDGSEDDDTVDSDVNSQVNDRLGLPGAPEGDPLLRKGMDDESDVAGGTMDGDQSAAQDLENQDQEPHEQPQVDANGRPIDPERKLPQDEEDPFAQFGESTEYSTIVYKNPLKDPAGQTDNGPASDEEKVKVPSEVKSDLRAAIDDHKKDAMFADKVSNDIRASHSMTIVGAFEELQDLLNLGTVQSIKMAQVRVTSWMSPIRAHLPTSVQKFVMMGGRKPNLRDLFDSKRAEKKL
jgi:hypothetical protein